MPFITFEGIDGSGKSTLIKNFAAYLATQGLVVEITREPGGSDLGQEIRGLLLKTTGSPPRPEAELLLYEADRAQHVATKIKPWLENDIWVLSDRFSDSSLAFQGAGRSIEPEAVKWLNEFATQGLLPKLTIIVDCPVEEASKRLRKREKNSQINPDRFEIEKKEFHERVRDEYLKMAKTAQRFFVIDGTKKPDVLLDEVVSECKKRKVL
jgi:dTMP kinase